MNCCFFSANQIIVNIIANAVRHIVLFFKCFCLFGTDSGLCLFKVFNK